MAWTAPRDWTAISGGIVTAASLNTDVRDNLGVLSTHAHTGGDVGQGASTMTGLNLTALVNLTFAVEGAPTSAGELQRHGNDLKFYGSSAVNLTASDASAGTASLRSLGTTSTTAAAGNHTHTIAQEAFATTGWTGLAFIADNVEHIALTLTRAADDAANAIVLSASFVVSHIVDATYPMTVKLRTSGTVFDTEVITTSSGRNHLHTLFLPGTTDSTDYTVTAQQDKATYNTSLSGELFLTEIEI